MQAREDTEAWVDHSRANNMEKPGQRGNIRCLYEGVYWYKGQSEILEDFRKEGTQNILWEDHVENPALTTGKKTVAAGRNIFNRQVVAENLNARDSGSTQMWSRAFMSYECTWHFKEKKILRPLSALFRYSPAEGQWHEVGSRVRGHQRCRPACSTLPLSLVT